MVEEFHNELRKLKADVVVMGSLAREMLAKSIESMKKSDHDLANWVLSRKCEIADMDEQIEAKALELLTLYQPMARDMRAMGCILKMITYLNRIGRYAKDIAKITVELGDKPHVNKLVSIPHMWKIVDKMIDDALSAFEQESTENLQNFSEIDDDVDSMRYSIYREALSYMIENPSYITQCTHYIMTARYLERCADHGVKMAEKIIYMVEGTRVDLDPCCPVHHS